MFKSIFYWDFTFTLFHFLWSCLVLCHGVLLLSDNTLCPSWTKCTGLYFALVHCHIFYKWLTTVHFNSDVQLSCTLIFPHCVWCILSGLKATQQVKIPPKALLNKRNGCGETLLHKACRRDNLAQVKVLLQAGINVNIQDYAGRSWWKLSLHITC